MKIRIIVFIALVALIPTMATADLWSDLKKIAKDAAVETITPKAEPAPKPAAVVQPTAAPKPTATKSKADKTRKLTRAEVTELQQCLNRLGFNAGTPDGISGRKTRNAVTAMQEKGVELGRANPPDGIVNLAALNECNVIGMAIVMQDTKDDSAEKSKNLKGTFLVDRANSNGVYTMTWEGKVSVLGFTRVRFYFAGAAGRFRFKGNRLLVTCENATEIINTPTGAFRNDNHAPSVEVCGSREGRVISITYAQ